jgi:hypothetical protein
MSRAIGLPAGEFYVVTVITRRPAETLLRHRLGSDGLPVPAEPCLPPGS